MIYAAPADAVRVLLVDDNPADRALARRALAQEFGDDLEVAEANSPDGLGAALSAGGFTLVVTDYQLGWSDGLAVLHAVKDAAPDVPVLMFTNSGSEEVAVEAMKSGLDDYVIKSSRNLVRLRVAARAALYRAEARRAAEELRRRLAEAEERFRLLVEGVNEYALFVIDPAGVVTSWNPGGERILGYAEDEIVGQSFARFFTPEDRAAGGPERELREAAATGRASDDGWHVRKDGTRLYIHGVLTALHDESGRLRGFAKVMRDMTEAHQRQVRLERAYEREHRIAETLQRSLLSAPNPDAYPGVTVKALYEPAYDDALIGGDWFDVYALGDGVVALVVGDTTGKGIDSATYTAELKFGLRAILRAEPRSPARALARLNELVLNADQTDRAHLGASYVAAALALYDTATGRVVGSAAGIEPPFVVRADTGEAVVLDGANGPLLGAAPADVAVFAEASAVLAPGDILAMATDGITEAREGGRRGSAALFGLEGLAAAVAECRDLPSLAEVADQVGGRALAFAGGRRHDDVCLLLARCRPQDG